ncbi:MAG: helix-turn-helix transcriptional regulator, partial [Actinomycetota bacterium]|nr:helix-turn-helix transcriptional regulator [Actinomycetota bacterium]
MNVTYAQTVAATVRAEMARANVKQAELANVLGISQAALSRKTSARVPFRLDELQAAAHHLGIAVEVLTNSKS